MNVHNWGKYLAAASTLVSVGLSANQARSEDDVAKQLANPIASLVSIPVTLDYDSGYGPADGDHVSVTLKPVIPFKINDDYSIVTRTIIPIIGQHNVTTATSGTQYGWGDVNMSAWVVPSSIHTSLGEFTFGIGGSLDWPISNQPPNSTGPLLGAGEWAIGPTGVFLLQQSGWTVGVLVTQQWGFEQRRPLPADTDLTLLQPFLSYTNAEKYTFAVNTESSYNWNTDEWSIPLNFTVSKLTTMGSQLVQYQLGARYWADSATGGPDGWGLRAQVTFLFPD